MGEEVSASDYEAMMEEGRFPDGMVEFAEMMIHDERIPRDVRKLWWGFINKDTILTRSDNNDDKWSADNDFAIRRNFHLMSQPAYKNDITEMVKLDNIRRRFITQHRRSIGGFERQALMTQIKELRTNKPSDIPGTSLMASLKRKFGLGPKPEEGRQYGQ